MTSGGGYTYTYDNVGNMTSETQTSNGNVWNYTSDYDNRMTGAVEKNSGGTVLAQVTYTYDALGRQSGLIPTAPSAGPCTTARAPMRTRARTSTVPGR